MPLGRVYRRDSRNNAMVRIDGYNKPVVLSESDTRRDITEDSIVLVKARGLSLGERVYFCSSYGYHGPNYRPAIQLEIDAYREGTTTIDLVLYDEPRHFALILGKWRNILPTIESMFNLSDEDVIFNRMYVLKDVFKKAIVERLREKTGKLVLGDFPLIGYGEAIVLDLSLLQAVYPVLVGSPQRKELERLILEHLHAENPTAIVQAQ